MARSRDWLGPAAEPRPIIGSVTMPGVGDLTDQGSRLVPEPDGYSPGVPVGGQGDLVDRGGQLHGPVGGHRHLLS